MKFIKENKGQAGDVFRLMIDAIIGLVILVMIISTISYFNSLRVQVSAAEMRGLIEGVVETPSGSMLESKELAFSGGEGYSGAIFEDWTGVPKECFYFQSRLGNIKITEGPGGRASFVRPVTAKVYAVCIPSGESCDYGVTDVNCCEINCIISFGRMADISEISFE